MGSTDALDSAERQLDRVLAFFPRVDAKNNAMFALNTGILGFGLITSS
jgi:hypothetical protein